MERECLSGIKPERGTNRNEALHKQLNRIISSSRYGIELAYALLSTIFFKHNEKIQASLEHRRERAVEEYESIFFNNLQSQSSVEHFGLEWSHTVKAAPCDTGSQSHPQLFIWLLLWSVCIESRITKDCMDASLRINLDLVDADDNDYYFVVNEPIKPAFDLAVTLLE